jgi:hypothetical protein
MRNVFDTGLVGVATATAAVMVGRIVLVIFFPIVG